MSVSVYEKDGKQVLYGTKQVRLRILHVWCQAGVSGVLAKYQCRLGHCARILKLPQFDGLSIDSYYLKYHLIKPYPVLYAFNTQGYMMLFQNTLNLIKRYKNAFKFFVYLSLISRKFDIIHIHSLYVACWFVAFKPKVLHFHGSATRKYFKKQYTYKLHRKFDFIVNMISFWVFKHFTPYYVATKDLLLDLPDATYAPNPVDFELFQKPNSIANGKALYIHNWYEDYSRAKQLAQEHNLVLEVLDREKPRDLLYHSQMPKKLSKYQFFIDREVIPSLSKTALESLAMGLTVFDWRNRLVEGLPEQHYPIRVAKKWIEIYRKQLKK